MNTAETQTKTPNVETVKLTATERPLPSVAHKGKGKARKTDPLGKYARILRLASDEFAKSDAEKVAAEKPLSNQPIPDRLAKSLSVWAKVNGTGDAKLDRASHKAFVEALDKTRQVRMPDGKQATLSIRSVKYARPDSSGVPTEQRYGAVLTRALDQGERTAWVTERVQALNRWLKANKA
jgi:hypothetical protein